MSKDRERSTIDVRIKVTNQLSKYKPSQIQFKQINFFHVFILFQQIDNVFLNLNLKNDYHQW